MLKHPYPDSWSTAQIHPHGYWLDEHTDGYWFDLPLATQLTVMFEGQSVADFGCGLGDYVRHFRKANINCEGFDGNPLTSCLFNNAKVLDLA